jgi:hypothetical protein
MALNICNSAYYALYPKDAGIVSKTNLSLDYSKLPTPKNKLCFTVRNNLLIESKKDIYSTFNEVPSLLSESKVQELPVIYNKSINTPVFELNSGKTGLFSFNSSLPDFLFNNDRYLEDIISNANKSIQVYMNNENFYPEECINSYYPSVLPGEPSNMNNALTNIKDKVSPAFYEDLKTFYDNHSIDIDPNLFLIFDHDSVDEAFYLRVYEPQREIKSVQYIAYHDKVYHDRPIMLFKRFEGTHIPSHLIEANPKPFENLPFYYKWKKSYLEFPIPSYDQDYGKVLQKSLYIYKEGLFILIP